MKMDKTKAKNKLIKHYCNLCKNAKENGISIVAIRKVILNSSKKSDFIKNSEKKGNIWNFEKESKQTINKKINRKRKCSSKGLFWNKYIFAVVFVIGLISASAVFQDSIQEMFEIDTWRCIVENNAVISEMTRPIIACNFCSTLKSVSIEYAISLQNFSTKYAYTSVPVLIKNATYNWSAMEIFSYQYLKNLYTDIEGALSSVDEECQFFHYNTDFENLTEVFSMSDARANFTEGEKPWYIGW